MQIDRGKQINEYLEAVSLAKPQLEKMHGLELASLEIQIALSEELQIAPDSPTDLLDRSLSSEEIVELLEGFPFAEGRPEVLATFELVDGVIPECYPGLLLEQRIKVKGEIWEVHKNDSDPYPSNPHAHNYEKGFKLHLGTGGLYKNGVEEKRISKKKLKLIRSKLREVCLPELER